MALFRRRRSADSLSAVAIDDFWSSWADVREALAASIDARTAVPAEEAQRLDERVQRIHQGLGWEVSPAPAPDPADLAVSFDDPAALFASLESPSDASAPTPAYALTLRAGEDDDARVLAERWYRAAPEDAAWAFFPSVPADHGRLTKSTVVSDHELDLSHTSVSLRVDHASGRIEVGVYHPDFMFLPEEVQLEVAEQVTMLALGEDHVVRWISTVRPLVEKPLDPLPPTSMPSVVEQLSGIGSSGGWVTLQGRVPLRGPVQIAVRHPLHRRDYPAFSLYVQVVVGYADTDDDKLPAQSSAAALDAFALGLRGLLGNNGALLAHQTIGGQRIFHFYLDPESGVLPELQKAVAEWPEGKTQLQSALEPEWDTINQILKPIRRQLGR
ncbi:DUF695 domain-containing protein [Nocardiopsis ansamitocini]|uniref:DUF695 domain-containing protein n=1 Tax=Nocardiopsis ansamitocini TaxID=1670832 RepID=A0A9W6UG66_9ACTN|nr:DUF695 domain-containing protein [Nocardiopsis ansamitocini]GLU46666.1 hypothetical protein Nans01_10170 [Nocardiopsis ansamitocini]